MVLDASSASRRNQMPPASRPNRDVKAMFQAYDGGPPPPKRRKPSPSVDQPRLKQTDAGNEIPDSDEEAAEELLLASEEPPSHLTDLEQALPDIRTDKEAIQEYEAMRAAQAADPEQAPQSSPHVRQWIPGKSSIYVDAFNHALDTVLADESHLFDATEMKLFDDWRALSYEAQYLYVRLFLRKTSAWHRINKLKYYGDIADLDAAVETLFAVRKLPESDEEATQNPGELHPPEGTTLADSYSFADRSDDHITTLEEASSLLLLDELKTLSKEAKSQGRNKTELLKSLRRTSGAQTSLGFAGLKRSDSELSGTETPESRDRSPDKREANRDQYYIKKILDETGPCIRLSLGPLKLFERVHLVFYRSTEWTEKSLVTIILAQIARRNFPEYIVSRSASIFPSRSLLLEFEASLRTQFRIDSVLEFNGTPKREGLESILEIFEEVLPRWRVLLKEEQRKEDSIYASGEGAYLRRLSPAWVYTRIVHKGAYVLGTAKFKDYAQEHSIISGLLDQRLFHHARRGAWYQRKALLEEHYMHALSDVDGRTEEEQKKHWKRIALQTCEQGLQDNLVHVIYHYDLQKRLTKLEKKLRIPKRLQHEFTHTRLAKPAERTFSGIQIEKRVKAVPQARRLSDDSATTTRNDEKGGLRKASGKTIWLDPAEPEPTECNVESMCLSRYRELGWKGFHSEGGILRTLFALLMYDVLFAYVPNVFQTPYQTCPLDLHSDAFYPTRLSEINVRLAEISNGTAANIIKATWEQQAQKQTCVVGLRWDFALEDLLEIVSCLEGEKLATLCKVIAQEYAERGGGVPDLFLWRTDEKRCLFAEVKSENDRLSDTQRLWIHVLTGAGIPVELCHAVASEVQPG